MAFRPQVERLPLHLLSREAFPPHGVEITEGPQEKQERIPTLSFQEGALHASSLEAVHALEHAHQEVAM